MLVELKIDSLGIIDELTWNPGSGLNIITGETGAGKSLVIDAISSLIEGSLDKGAIRHGADLARLEGVFCLSPESSTPLTAFLPEKGIAIDKGGLIISSEFRKPGRYIFRLNGTAVSRPVLREAGHLLVNIHSQSQHLALFARENQMDYLDSYGRTVDARERFRNLFMELSELKAELNNLDRAQRDIGHREEALNYQIEEIKRAKLQDDEEQQLMRERQIVASGEKLKSFSFEACQALNGEENVGTALSRLFQAMEALRHLAAIDPSLKTNLSVLEDAYLNVRELARDLSAYHEGLDFDPQRLEEVDSRLELLRSLKKKYGGTLTAIKEYLASAETELATIAGYFENRTALEVKISNLKKQMGIAAGELSERRQKAAGKLAAAVKKELRDLNLKQVAFEVMVNRRPDPDGLPVKEETCAFGRTGIDQVDFMVSTNPGEPLKPLAEIASTGEVSRFTLAMKVALAEADRTPVLIFDEIDIGVGGRSAEVIGQKLWRLARHHQVICVTHLPQIAAYGDCHFRVEKESRGKRTVSRLCEVKGTSRLKELALMIGGPSLEETAGKTAAELNRSASRWISSQAAS